MDDLLSPTTTHNQPIDHSYTQKSPSHSDSGVSLDNFSTHDIDELTELSAALSYVSASPPDMSLSPSDGSTGSPTSGLDASPLRIEDMDMSDITVNFDALDTIDIINNNAMGSMSEDDVAIDFG